MLVMAIQMSALGSYLLFCNDVRSLIHKLDSCVFNWVRRDANVVAHNLAQFVAHSQPFTFCNVDSLPPLVKEARLRDVSFLV